VSPAGAMPKHVTIYEVGPRDGLQNEAGTVSTETKVAFINLLAEAGLPVIEATSFVRPGAIPQLADAEEVVEQIARLPATRYTALVPNARGMERAQHANLFGVALFTASSETFSRHNTNASIAETIERFKPVITAARRQHLWVRGYVSTAFGCPYEGPISIDAVRAVSRDLVNLGVDEVAISDTIGMATPGDVTRLVGALLHDLPVGKLALHFHDTRGTALANVLMGLQMGIATFDSAAGGLGGCPYAPGATGNLATEDLVYMLNGLGIETGVSLEGLVAASAYMAETAGRVPPSRYFRAATA
jgi:hydroxymethylglutaryl-CoA lyase